jgi:uncharacterized protein with LGFP repeats
MRSIFPFGEALGVTQTTDRGDGAYQAFENGVVYLRPDGNAVPMFGNILGTWRCRLAGSDGVDCQADKTGPLPALGYPKDREHLKFNEAWQDFDLGGIYCYKGCHVLTEPLRSIWVEAGGGDTRGIGLPIKDVEASDQLGGGWLGRFNEGFIFTDFRGVAYVASSYGGEIVKTSLPLTDCFGFAEAVKGMS